VGALLSGLFADAFGFIWAIVLVGGMTFLSGIQVAWGMREKD
jgi:hypothetical protein